LHGCDAPDLHLRLRILGKQTGPNKKRKDPSLKENEKKRHCSVKHLVSTNFVFPDILKQQNCNHH
jgi:hypothetical protein